MNLERIEWPQEPRQVSVRSLAAACMAAGFVVGFFVAAALLLA